MGLDMYLNKRTFIGAQYKHRNVKGELKLTWGNENKPIKINLNRVGMIEEQVGYWRKANQIHKWFVENAQDGKDECQDSFVPKEKMEELLSLCKQVKADPTKAPELLPSQEGFFFGGTEYGECYFQDIDDTIEILEAVLSDVDEDGLCLIYYIASW